MNIYLTRSKGFALTWYRALNWYSSSARPFAALGDPQLVTGQQGSPSPACQQPSRARNVCAGGSSEGSTKLKHGTKLGRTLCYPRNQYVGGRTSRRIRPSRRRCRRRPAARRFGRSRGRGSRARVRGTTRARRRWTFLIRGWVKA